MHLRYPGAACCMPSRESTAPPLQGGRRREGRCLLSLSLAPSFTRLDPRDCAKASFVSSSSLFFLFFSLFHYRYLHSNVHCKLGISLTTVNSSTLTPMHLRKAKLMFFWVRYPSSAVLKMYFPDIKFNKNNTAQLVKWFSNFR